MEANSLTLLDYATQVATIFGVGGLITTIFGAIFAYYLEKRKQAREVFLARLKIINEYFERYYIPITKLSLECATALSNALELSSELNLKFAFFQTEQLLRADYDWTVKGGGQVILSDYQAEEKALTLYERAMNALPFSQLEISTLQKNANRDELFIDSWSNIDENKDMNKIFITFKEWLADSSENVEEVIMCLRYFFEYLWYELNNIQKVWYKGNPPPLSIDCKKYIDQIVLN